MGLVADLAGTFAIGLLTPLSAACVLPLYPGFVAYLANQEGDVPVSLLGAAVVAGVVGFMLLVGIVFAAVLEVSLTSVIEVVSPAAFVLLLVLGLLLLFDADVVHALPTVEPPTARHPALSAFAYGAFFGAIVLPCNPAFIALFFARAFLIESPIANLLNFLAFGLGIGAPLLALAVASDRYRRRVIGALTSHRGLVNRASGAAMIAVAAYYLVFVFEVVPLSRP